MMSRRSWEYLAAGLGFGSTVLSWLALREAQRLIRHFIHPARYRRAPDEFPSFLGASYTDIVLHTADGLRLSAWYTPPRNGVAIIALHGNSTARHHTTFARFALAGYGVIAFDFRAHGLSEGEVCTLGFQELLDAEAALAYLLHQPAVQRIGVWGSSMGAVTAIRLAARHPEIGAVVADSGFASLEGLMRSRRLPRLVQSLFLYLLQRETGLRLRDLRPEAEIGQIAPRPVFIIHGGADQLVPYQAALRLYEAAGAPKRLWIEPGMRHTELRHRQPERYWTEVLGFFAAALRSP